MCSDKGDIFLPQFEPCVFFCLCGNLIKHKLIQDYATRGKEKLN